jgi:hypothetical protein
MQPQPAAASSRRRDVAGGQGSSRAPRRTAARTVGNLAASWVPGGLAARILAHPVGLHGTEMLNIALWCSRSRGRSGFAALSSRCATAWPERRHQLAQKPRSARVRCPGWTIAPIGPPGPRQAAALALSFPATDRYQRSTDRLAGWRLALPPWPERRVHFAREGPSREGRGWPPCCPVERSSAGPAAGNREQSRSQARREQTRTPSSWPRASWGRRAGGVWSHPAWAARQRSSTPLPGRRGCRTLQSPASAQ